MITCEWMSVEDFSCEDVLDLLDQRTRDRVKSCVRAQKAKEIALGMLMLQTLAGRMLNIKPSDVFIRYSSEGRPYLDSSELFLNLSHCDGKCVVLISDIRAGCDLQSVRPFGGEAVRAFFSEKDFDHIAKSDDPDFEMTRIWCIREALYKFPGAELPDIGLFLKKVSASDRAAFSEEYGIRLFEERIDDLILAVVTEKAVDTDSLEIKRFQDNIMM